MTGIRFVWEPEADHKNKEVRLFMGMAELETSWLNHKGTEGEKP